MPATLLTLLGQVDPHIFGALEPAPDEHDLVALALLGGVFVRLLLIHFNSKLNYNTYHRGGYLRPPKDTPI